jgi:nucleoside-diphosphate-sugar epimerase
MTQSTLVIGGAGFCGAYLCEALLQRGARVAVLDKAIPPDSYLHRAGLTKDIHILHRDILELATLKLVLRPRFRR